MNILDALELQDHDLARENDQLRAQVAALEAEVAQMKEPVGLVWQRDGKKLISQEFGDYWYEVQPSLIGGFYSRMCSRLSVFAVCQFGPDRVSEKAAIAACAAHHAARYREMQGTR